MHVCVSFSHRLTDMAPFVSPVLLTCRGPRTDVLLSREKERRRRNSPPGVPRHAFITGSNQARTGALLLSEYQAFLSLTHTNTCSGLASQLQLSVLYVLCSHPLSSPPPLILRPSLAVRQGFVNGESGLRLNEKCFP